MKDHNRKDHKLPVGISGSTLKILAIVTMFIDHTGATVLRAILNQPHIMDSLFNRDIWVSIYSASRSIGRLAFPIFCFLLVEGFVHTHNVYKYVGRMFLFALISEVPFDIALKGNLYFPQKQNVYFTLLIGLLVLTGISRCERLCGFRDSGSKQNTHASMDSVDQNSAPASADSNRSGMSALKPTISMLLFAVLSIAIIYAGMSLASHIDTDYNYKGVFLIAVLYLLKKNRLYQCAAGSAAVAWELPASLSFIPIFLYNGTRGRQMKYFFYWFYPVHLLLLHFAADYLIPLL